MKMFTMLAVAATVIAHVSGAYTTLKEDLEHVQSASHSLYIASKHASGTRYSDILKMSARAKMLNAALAQAQGDAARLERPRTLSRVQTKEVLGVLADTYSDVSGLSQRLIALKPALARLGARAGSTGGSGGAGQDAIQLARAELEILAAGFHELVGTSVAGLVSSSSRRAVVVLGRRFDAALASVLRVYSS